MANPAWQPEAVEGLRAGKPTVLVTVLRSAGSAPRGGGAKIWINETQTWGTIGGGHLEYQAIALAREILASTVAPQRKIQRYALGPSLGQCCGGVVWLAFERLDAGDLAWCNEVEAALEQRRSVIRRVPFNDADPVQIHLSEQAAAGFNVDEARWDDDQGVLEDRIMAASLTVVVCGAGHVGRAIINVLGTLPVNVVWLDPRDDLWPEQVPANVQCLQGDAEDVRDLPNDACWLVLTHNHALDLEIVQEIMARKSFRFLGLIGSATKKARFVSRLRRQFPEAMVARMQCPIGLVKTSSKLPEVIAVSAVAQLLSLD
ncbi:xanthine dehydrogenase accessory protein XdhC [Neopusillimonas maritima]|nr:xanthine dehydrogenase accessory protein XdhC [Neopusillimonas maritima]